VSRRRVEKYGQKEEKKGAGLQRYERAYDCCWRSGEESLYDATGSDYTVDVAWPYKTNGEDRPQHDSEGSRQGLKKKSA